VSTHEGIVPGPLQKMTSCEWKIQPVNYELDGKRIDNVTAPPQASG
jgi:hypothetical protein